MAQRASDGGELSRQLHIDSTSTIERCLDRSSSLEVGGPRFSQQAKGAIKHRVSSEKFIEAGHQWLEAVCLHVRNPVVIVQPLAQERVRAALDIIRRSKPTLSPAAPRVVSNAMASAPISNVRSRRSGDVKRACERPRPNRACFVSRKLSPMVQRRPYGLMITVADATGSLVTRHQASFIFAACTQTTAPIGRDLRMRSDFLPAHFC